ncbi:MAG: spondin domain-containing protein [Rhodothermales bacterium]
MLARVLTFLFALTLAPLAVAQSTATYRVTFESTWSAATHPDGFPPDPHFSGLIGAAHDATATLWENGGIASDGIEQMAETGSKTLLRNEVEALLAQDRALAVVSGGGIGLSPGAVTLTFDVTEDHSLVSLVTMLAPSPDWFVGVSGLDLFDDGAWLPERAVDLFVYDAGTDSGPTYTSPNQDTDPPEPITRIVDAPFATNGTVGTFTFTLLNVTGSEDAAPATAFALAAPTPNPAVTRTTLRLQLGTAQPVRVEVFDLLGRRVATLHDGVLAPGSHPFDLDVRALPSGIYFARVQGAGTQATRRFVVR